LLADLNGVQVTNIWYAGKDLINPGQPIEARTAGFELLTACVKNGSSTDLERKEYFETLTASLDPDDFHLQLAALIELAKNGKDLSGFQYDVVPLLTTWLRKAFEAASAARRHSRSTHNKTPRPKTALGEETNLAALFDFLVDVIRFSFNSSDEENTGALIDEVLLVCTSTPVASDLKAAINLLNTIITYGAIPNEKLEECIKVLCAIHCLVHESQAEAWRAMSNLSKSHHGQTTVRILLDILRNQSVVDGPQKQTIREVRGSISVLEALISKDGQHGYPFIPFTLLMDGLSKAVLVNHPKVAADILHLILSLFSREDHVIHANIMDENWKIMFDVVSACSQSALDSHNSVSLTSRTQVLSPLAATTSHEDVETQALTTTAQMLQSLIVRIEDLFISKSSGIFLQREDCIAFFMHVHDHLPESCAMLVIDYYMDSRLCYPSEPEWRKNCDELLRAFFSAHNRSTSTRLRALTAVTEVFEIVEMMDEPENPYFIRDFVSAIVVELGEETDTAVLQEVISFAVSVVDNADYDLFTYVLDALHGGMSNALLLPSLPTTSPRNGYLSSDSLGRVSTHSSTSPSPSSVISKGVVRIFMRAMDSSSPKAIRAFDELIWIARSACCETDARLSAMKLLFRLRADWANRIFLTPFTESEGLAAALYRTPASLAHKQAVDEASQQARLSRADDFAPLRGGRSASAGQTHTQTPRNAIRTASGLTRTLQRDHQMWLLPDDEALPEPITNKASPQLKSVSKEPVTDDSATLSESDGLKMNVWLETIINMLQQERDWEVYSFVLVHLPSQLSNHALFKDAVPQVKLLRSVLCEQIKSNTFHEPSLSSGLRKADVSICLFQILTMVVSYHGEFSKNEEDEIVRTFIQGIGSWERAAKSCIHALSICCHELPQSTSKSLVTILQKMSQIITQAHVAVHILEFLACLARLPALYSNFRDDEYRIVFGICFRYLQYVRDQSSKEANRTSHYAGRHVGTPNDTQKSSIDLVVNLAESNLHPNTSDELPQYVYSLAHHVITFWFLSLRLSDRAGQVGWITKNLVSTDHMGREQIDEQAQVTIDYMQRVAFADLDESKADPEFTEEKYGEILKKRWILGSCIVTIEQSTRSGWAQITKRQPTGTSCYIIRENFERPPPHQESVSVDNLRDGRHSDSNVILPSYLLLQLTANNLQSSNYQRPLPLIDDDATVRAIRTFDRIPTIDGHKVGVIYLGENQTNEVEILANVMGSSDYTEFLSGLGTLTKLHGATFNTQGLDREYNTDGEYAFCWRDRVTEMVFHVTTQMPTNLEHDPQCIFKKRHIGNDFVNIIFNNSGLPFKFDTFPSEFNYVNIVITPESRASFVATRVRSQTQTEACFYKVQVMSKPGFPEISPAAETKIVSLKALPDFIRLLALNASVFSLVWSTRHGGEHVSSWRTRLRAIMQLKERTLTAMAATVASSTTTQGNSAPSGERNVRDSLGNMRRASVATLLTTSSDYNSPRSSMVSSDTEVAHTAGEDSLVEALDFSRWA
jgi:hypothetical protein